MDKLVADNFDTYNQSFLENYLKQKIHEVQRYELNLSVFILGVDNLSTFTNSEQQYIIDRITFLLSTLIRKSDLLAKCNDFEHTVILPSTDLQGALNATQKIKNSIDSAEFEFDKKPLSITISFGVTDLNFSDDYKSFLDRVAALLKNAKKKTNFIEIM